MLVLALALMAPRPQVAAGQVRMLPWVGRFGQWKGFGGGRRRSGRIRRSGRMLDPRVVREAQAEGGRRQTRSGPPGGSSVWTVAPLVTCTAFFPSLGPADEPAVAAGAPYPLPALVPSPPPLGIVPAPLAPCRAAPLPAGAPLSMASRRRPTGGGNGMRGRLGRARDGRGGFRDGDVLLRRRAAHVPAMAVSAVAGWGGERLGWLSLAAAVGSLRLGARMHRGCGVGAGQLQQPVARVESRGRRICMACMAHAGRALPPVDSTPPPQPGLRCGCSDVSAYVWPLLRCGWEFGIRYVRYFMCFVTLFELRMCYIARRGIKVRSDSCQITRQSD